MNAIYSQSSEKLSYRTEESKLRIMFLSVGVKKETCLLASNSAVES